MKKLQVQKDHAPKTLDDIYGSIHIYNKSESKIHKVLSFLNDKTDENTLK